MPLKKSNNGNICGQKHRDQDKTQAPAKLIASGTRDADFDGGIIGVLLHGTGLPSSYIWVEWLELLMANGLKVHVYFHVDSIVKQEELLTLPGWELIQKHLAPRQYRSSWSSPGLAKTELKLMRDLLHMHPKASHVMIAGGTHLPVLIDPFKHCKPNESWLPNMNLDNGFPICLGNGVLLAQDRMMKNPLTAHYWRSLGIDFNRIYSLIYYHHQWVCLAACHIRLLLQPKNRAILYALCQAVQDGAVYEHKRLTAAHLGDPEPVPSAPDEYIFGTMLRYLGVVFAHSQRGAETKLKGKQTREANIKAAQQTRRALALASASANAATANTSAGAGAVNDASAGAPDTGAGPSCEAEAGAGGTSGSGSEEDEEDTEGADVKRELTREELYALMQQAAASAAEAAAQQAAAASGEAAMAAAAESGNCIEARGSGSVALQAAQQAAQTDVSDEPGCSSEAVVSNGASASGSSIAEAVGNASNEGTAAGVAGMGHGSSGSDGICNIAGSSGREDGREGLAAEVGAVVPCLLGSKRGRGGKKQQQAIVQVASWPPIYPSLTDPEDPSDTLELYDDVSYLEVTARTGFVLDKNFTCLVYFKDDCVHPIEFGGVCDEVVVGMKRRSQAEMLAATAAACKATNGTLASCQAGPAGGAAGSSTAAAAEETAAGKAASEPASAPAKAAGSTSNSTASGIVGVGTAAPSKSQLKIASVIPQKLGLLHAVEHAYRAGMPFLRKVVVTEGLEGAALEMQLMDLWTLQASKTKQSDLLMLWKGESGQGKAPAKAAAKARAKAAAAIKGVTKYKAPSASVKVVAGKGKATGRGGAEPKALAKARPTAKAAVGNGKAPAAKATKQ